MPTNSMIQPVMTVLLTLSNSLQVALFELEKQALLAYDRVHEAGSSLNIAWFDSSTLK